METVSTAAESMSAVRSRHEKNVGTTERYISMAGGAALLGYGATRRNLGGALLALAGGSLLYRGATGHCSLYQALKINTDRPERGGILVQKSITINAEPMAVYQFWRKLENLPRFMVHLESVREIDSTRSHWVAKAPAGTSVEWDAEITEDAPGHHIAWRSVEGETVPNTGSVAFLPSKNGLGTELKVSLRYQPPAGEIGAAIAKLFGEEPSIQIQEDLHRLKQVIETGAPSTTTGQPHGLAVM